MYGLILTLGMTTAPVVPDAHPFHRGTGCTGATAVRSAGCSGSVSHGRAVTRTRSVVATASVAPVIPVAAPPVVVPPLPMAGPGTTTVVARPTPVTAGMGFFADRTRTLFGRVRGVCSGGNCGR